ncbi:MAG: ATPase [Gammaproteobacteria bacterium]|nr:MAG: ATPase [Gammaproteobacteria bacterium]
MSKNDTSTVHSIKTRSDRLIQELNHDPYHTKLKLKEPTACPQCDAIYQEGRWRWGDTPADAHKTLCPACQRINDKVPAAFLTLSGDFLTQHKDEIMSLINNYAQHEKTEHLLKRLMDSEEQDGKLLITFTDPHLARGIGEALQKAYDGDLNYQYTKGEIMLRVSWSR